MRYRSSSVFSLGTWTSHLPTGLACPAVLCAACSPYVYGAFTLYSGPFQNLRLDFCCCGLLRFRSPLLAEYFLFLRLLRCFSSPGSLAPDYVFTGPYRGIPPVGFPIRTSPAQMAAHTSPELFAVYRVLHRRLTPVAFTIRPCSFSALVLRRIRLSRVTCNVMYLVKSRRSAGTRVYPRFPLQPDIPELSPGEGQLRKLAPPLFVFCV